MKWLLLSALLLAGHGGNANPPPAADFNRSKGIVIGENVPPFSLLELDGKKVHLADLIEGKKPVLLVFWCTTCGSCRLVEKKIEKFAEENRGKASVVLVDANHRDTPGTIKSFLYTNGLKLKILKDPHGALAKSAGVRMTTTTLLVDGEGILRYFGEFGHEEPFAQNALKSVLSGEKVEVERGPIWG